MSLLKSVLNLARRPYTCMFVQRCIRPATLNERVQSFHASASLLRYDEKNPKKEKDEFARIATGLYTDQKMEVEELLVIEETEPSSEESDPSSTSKATVTKSVRFALPEYQMGNYFPTTDVYETTYNGVKFPDLPIVYVNATYNNTKAGAYIGRSQAITVQTGGKVGFKHTKKKTSVCGQTVGFAIGLDLVKLGYTNVRVIVRGLGAGRLPSIKGLQQAGVNIVSITDRTFPDVANRPRKRPR